ncbi:AT-rich interactive domain-containing protein 2 isoform X3 [Nasonia vitripennis]|uniref:AT-rich interactive domain-containing protein 2 n=1 Tax=Nasonia vitripennis TaxID=7425 RepID=A0A7M7HH87_NASVI|nr:AT-rich interactive domain-containing protein 2 isoform X3 [Nasonia vitripennis]
MALQQSPANQQQAAKDPVSYERLREAFIRDLHHFHDTRGTPFKKCPRIDGKEVDLYKLYTVVTARGGWIQVNNKNEWVWLCEEFHLPSGCVNSGVGLKQIYLRYLDRYEKVHFLGEDGHQGDDDDEDSRHRKWNARSLHSVPLTYNHHQHNVAESLREYNGLSSDLYKPSNYDKLALSLLSPLPNEQDFAINVCTFLSNEGKHALRLDKYPRLINHLLAHAGIFDSPGTRQLFIEVYSRVRNYSINSFWPDVLDAQDVLDLTDERIFIKKPITANSQRFIRRRQEKERQRNQQSDVVTLDDAPCPMDIDNGPLECDRLENGIEILEERLNPHLIDENSTSSNTSSMFKDQNQNSIKFEDDDKDLFCVGRTLGTQDPYGQRVLQIASILRNLSFTPENAAVLGRSRSFLRFVLLCVRARWCNLHQLGFDILGNIANEIILKDAGERLTSVILSSVAKGIDSPDRFIVISCLEILNKVSQQDLNEETLTFGLDDSVYELICRFLALSDIALLVYTLECLYALTSLGERPCTSVARVRGAIDTLVALVTVEAQSYGPKACILMRVVETVSSVPASQQQQQQQQQSPQVAQQSSPSQQQQSQTISAAAAAAASSSVHHHVSTAPSQGAPMATSVSEPTGPDGQVGSTGSPSGSGQVTEVVAVRLAPHQMQQVKQQQTVQTVQAAQVAQVQAQSHTQQAQAQSAQPIQATPTKANAAGGSSRPSTPKAAAAKAAANSLQQQHTHQQIIQENEQFALGWLKATFELSPGVKIEQEELYKKYLGCCTKIGRRGVIAPLHFPRCVRSVFGGTIGPNPIKGENTGTLYYEGIRVRANPGQVTYPLKGVTRPNVTGAQAAENASGNVVTIVGGTSNVNSAKVQQQRNDSTPIQVTPSSPILKAQLSAPPKPSVHPDSPLSIAPSSAATGNIFPIEPRSQVSVAHPHLSQALLASGAQQQAGQQQQAQQVQVIVKDDGRGGTTSSSIIKSLLATKVTVAGECMQAVAVATSSSCVSAVPAITNATGVVSSISANQLITSNQVAQRQQQQQQQRQQQMQQTPGATIGTKTIINAKGKPTIVAVKKVQRLNGAKVIVANNGEKPEAMDTDNGLHATSNQQTQLAIASIVPPTSIDSSNHVTGVMRVYRGPATQQVTLTTASSTTGSGKQSNQQLRNVCTPIVEDSDSTNNSLASSSGIGGSRDCSGVGAEEENSLTSFEGILLNGAPSNLDIDAQDDGSSKDSSSVGSKEKPSQSMMLADLLERKVEKEPIMNGVLGKKDLVENHIKKVRVLKESPGDVKIKAEVSEDALIEAPARLGIKRSGSTLTNEADESCDAKKPKYSNGTTSPDPAVVDSTTLSSIKSEEQDDEKEEKVTVSSTAANLYAALAADIIDDETDLEEPSVKEEIKPVVKEEIKAEPSTPVAVKQVAVSQEQLQPVQQQVQVQTQVQPVQVQTVAQAQPQQHHPTHQTIAITQQQLQQQLQQGLIVAAAPRQIVVQQTIQSNNQIVTIPAMKSRPQHQIQPQVLQVQQGPGGQTHYVISGGVPGQNYVLAQPQTALVQGQAQTVLVAQQQGTNAKTIIILQPQAAAQPQAQKMVAVTPQGQQVVVTQVPRPLMQSPAMGNIPPPLVPTSGAISQASIVMNSAVAQQIQQQQDQVVSQQQTITQQRITQVQAQTQPAANTVTVVQTQQAAAVATTAGNSVPSRVVTPTPASTPPPTRPTTPRQAAATNLAPMTAPTKPQPQLIAPSPRTSTETKEVVMVTAATSTEPENTESTEGNNTKKSLTSQETSTSRPQSPATPMKTITVTLERNAFLCEWRGCFKQFKNPRKVYLHVVEAHCPTGNEETLCQWASCDGLKRRRFSLMTHLFDRHCCDEIMLMRRKQFDQSGKTEYLTSKPVASPTHHPGYAPNAALHAIKRHALEFVNPKELMDDNEGPVTKSIRLTAALILRNLVIYSAHGRRHLRAYEPHLAGVALSNVESSRTIAQVLYDMNDQSSSGHR